jgi:Phage Mu protein F like protein
MAKNILDLLDQYEPDVKRAFIEAIQEITSKVRLADLVKALERGDTNGALDVLYIDSAAYEAFTRVLADAYETGGKFTIDGLGTLKDKQGLRFVVRFSSRNQRAEQWIGKHSSDLVTRIVTEQRNSVREHLLAGLEAGNNPNTTALDIIGRMNPITKRREGGILGLSEPQEQAVRRARLELEQARHSDFLTRARRDKRFDSVLRKATADKRQLTKPEIEKMIGRYSDGLLKLRGQTIARTETLASLNAAQLEALKQVVDSGKVTADQIVREWDSAGDRRVRFDHAAADGQKTTLDGVFYVGGKVMRHPGDPAGGPENVINCRCVVKQRIDFFAGVT